jgi:SOS-response transcriptional repressor LexA
VAEHRYPPSWRDIANHIGASGPTAAHDHVQELVRKGLLTKRPRIPRSLALTEAGKEELAYGHAEAAVRRQLG